MTQTVHTDWLLSANEEHVMRLDWFLPVLRTRKAGRAERPVGWVARAARRILPARLFSNRDTKQRGLARQLLRRLGPVWLSSPIRRLIQTACFLLFLTQFFWVCWPYSAQPAIVSA
ncbi:MAG: hypothetical protein KDA85_00395, partial [Planctomycetaceae bacterium]|nr:hypothetical protein [Planctomycetaceae bacterium]